MIKGRKKVVLIVFGLLAIGIYLSISGDIMYGVYFSSGISCALFNCVIRYYANFYFLLKGNMSAVTFIGLYLLRLSIPVFIGFFLIKNSFESGLVFLLGFTVQFIILPHVSNFFPIKK
ncbi:hypothetical protein [Oceanirhabdus sp. W0125-5]|uniref:hypothetical protein n=1 Tax=Oceanirhabdus sp. W0125-5 TaxID=2999116 RepID=UPI0022F32133|nr:hypothetical protein [Oceanirhabdus sp. W0125-5]WBW98487.1 hypothetical protein OW730_06880 [Oceanirhabdus sp. W0125-5]